MEIQYCYLSIDNFEGSKGYFYHELELPLNYIDIKADLKMTNQASFVKL